MSRHVSQQQETPVEANRGEADRRSCFRFAVWLMVWVFVASFVEGQDRLPLPSDVEQKKAIATIGEIFREETSNAKTAAKQVDLARKMFRSLEDNSGAAATNYVLLKQAHELAVKAFNIGLVCETIDELDKRYEVDGLELQLQSIRDIARAPTDSKIHAELAQVAFGLVEECIRAERFDEAMLAVDQAMTIATNLKSNVLRKAAADRKARVAESQMLWQDYRAAVEILTGKADDAPANESAGRYLIAVKLDFDRGLPHLARGADSNLRATAKLDDDALNAGEPVSDELAVRLGDAWWDASAKPSSPLLKTAMRLRAAHWYSPVVTNMKGLSKLKTEQRIAESGWRNDAALAERMPRSPSWRGLESRFEAAMGWVHADFAICQSAPFTEALELNESLKTWKYRPVRFRPYSTPDGLKVAAIWHRQEGESRLFHGPEMEIQYRDKDLRKQNFWPVDLSGYVADGELRHVALWSDVKPANVTDVSLVMSVPDGTLPVEIKTSQPYTYHFYWTPSGDCQYDSLWSQPKGRFGYYRGELGFLRTKQVEDNLTLIDICVNSPKKPAEAIFGIVLQARNNVRVVEVRQTLEKNRLEWKRLAELKHRPVAIGVTVTPTGTTIAHSVWHSTTE
jgi:polyglycine hydrolase-like protein